MMSRRTAFAWTLVVAIAVTLGGPARAEFALIENFDGLVLGPIDDQNEWTASSDRSEVVTDPSDGTNQVLSVVTESTRLFKNVLVPVGEKRMLFFRFRFENQLNCSFGMSFASLPSRFDHFEAELSLTNSTSELRINDDGTYRVLEVLQPEVWYCCWMSLDNLENESRIWLHDRPGQPATAGDQLDFEGATVFAFRNGATIDLRNFYVKTGGGNGVDGPLLLDDLYLEDTDELNLACPLGSPTAAIESTDRFRPMLARPHPNPFVQSTRIDVSIPDPGPVRLVVCDLSGRHVASLIDGVHGGTLTASWDGRTDAGVLAAPGVYFVRLEAGRLLATRKLVLTR